MDHSVSEFPKLIVLVTGGTQGLGQAIGLEFACRGAVTYLTHRWGSADEAALRREFREAGAVEPHIVESDVSDPQATRDLMKQIRDESGYLDVIINNVAFAQVVRSFADLRKSTLDLSLNYSAWPLVEMIRAAHAVFGRYPRYVLAISSSGVDTCYEGYELAAASKAVLETLCRYLALRFKPYGVRVNAIRPGLLDTASSRATFGDELVEMLGNTRADLFLDPRAIARVCVGLCSGLMDAITGQVIVVDEGWSLVSPLALVTGYGLPGSFPKLEEERR